jgi:hypothetical protein
MKRSIGKKLTFSYDNLKYIYEFVYLGIYKTIHIFKSINIYLSSSIVKHLKKIHFKALYTNIGK